MKEKMRTEDRVKFGVIWVFNFCGDSIVYKRLLECTDIDSVKDYAKEWVKKFGLKYGRCLYCDIVYNAIEICTIHFDKKGNVKCEQNWIA